MMKNLIIDLDCMMKNLIIDAVKFQLRHNGFNGMTPTSDTLDGYGVIYNQIHNGDGEFGQSFRQYLRDKVREYLQANNSYEPQYDDDVVIDQAMDAALPWDENLADYLTEDQVS